MQQRTLAGTIDGKRAEVMVTVQIVRCEAGREAGRELEKFIMKKVEEEITT